MTEQIFEEIKQRSEKFKYTSLNYTDFEDISDYEVVSNNESLLLLHGFEHEFRVPTWHWACDCPETLLGELNGEGILPFVPKDWVAQFEAKGFAVRSIWHDYFKPDLSGCRWDETAEFLTEKECKEASEVTLSCKGQSRGFTGQTEGWVRDWTQGEDKDAKAIIRRCKGGIAGVVFVTIYGHESEKGPILWIREIAVRPEHQGSGIASRLLRQAFGYGVKQGATRAFLAADEKNLNAIRLYEKFGFEASESDGQIDMERA